MDKLYTTKELADLLQVNRMSIYNWVRRGKLSYIKLGSLVRFSEESVNKFLKETTKGR